MPYKKSTHRLLSCPDRKAGPAYVILLFLILSPPLEGLPICPQPAVTGTTVASYTVAITLDDAEQHELEVRAVIPVSGTTDLTVTSPDAGYGSSWISVEACYDSAGKDVRIEQLNNRTWRVSPSSAGDVIVEYRARTDIPSSMAAGTYLTYLSGSCGLLYGGAVFLRPSSEGSVTINVIMPAGWSLITDETWSPLNSTAFTVGTGDLELFAPGNWSVYEGTFGDGQRLRVAICGVTKYAKGIYLGSIKTCLDYFHQHIGDLPQEELNVVLADLPLPVDYMSGTPRLAVNRAGGDWGMFEGMLWHYWFLRALRYDSQLDQDRAWWFGEGASPFLLYPVYEAIGGASDVATAWGFRYSNLSWKNWYMVYKQYAGTKYNIPLVDYPGKSRETGDVQYYFPLPYMKGFLVLHMLNLSMVEVTHGAKDVRDVIKYVYENYAVKGAGYTVEDVLSAVNTVSGNDYAAFFEAYVYGNEALPIFEEGGDYLIDWATLGDKTYRTLANSEKVRPTPQYWGGEVPEGETATLLEMRKESRHFTVYFHQQDAKMAALLLLDSEKAYDAVTKIYGGEARLKVRMFMTYNSTEYAILGGNPSMVYGEGVSAGGVAVDAGDEINWLRPIPRMRTQMYDVAGPIHELGHALMRQIYPGIYDNWEQWFNEGAPLPEMAWLDSEWAPEGYSPFMDREPLAQLRTSLTGGSPSVIPLTLLAGMDYGSLGPSEQLLFRGEGIAFHFYVNSRYETGLQRLLTEYNRSVPLNVAAEEAFGETYAAVEKDLWKIAEKAALNINFTEMAISKVRREGVDVSLAQRLLSEEPFLALLTAYAAEARAGAGFERAVFGTITPGSPVKVDLHTTPLTSITATSSQMLENFYVTVEEVLPTEVPAAAGGRAYSYVRVNSSGGAGPVTIEFRVDSEWFSGHGLNASSTSLLRHGAARWTQLPTTRIGEDASYAYFSAVSPGMSTFAITASPNAGEVTPSAVDGWASPVPFGTPTSIFLTGDCLHVTVVNRGSGQPLIAARLVDSEGNILVDRACNVPGGQTGFGDYNSGKSLAPGSYRIELWNSSALLKVIHITLSTDIVPPTITSFTPSNGSTVTSGPVQITAAFSDDMGVNTGSVVLRLDGIDVTRSSTITAAGLSYTSTLGNGPHTAQLVLADAAGNTASSSVSFAVSLQQTQPNGSQCIIATATYGSEIAP